MSKYIKSHSNFVLKTKHQDTKDGVIYERDITTIGGRDRFSKGQVPVYRSGNFVITVNNEDTLYKKAATKEWKENESGNTWNLDILEGYEKDEKSSYDKRIVIKKDYYDLRDFSYFGSCSELMRASINGIIKKFPGELFVPVITAWVFNDSGNTKFYSEEIAEVYQREHPSLSYSAVPETISTVYTDYDLRSGEDYTELPIMREFKLPNGVDGGESVILFVIDNPFDINIHSQYIPDGADPLKYFADGGINNYVAYKKINDNWDFNTSYSISATTFEKYGTKNEYCPGDYMGYLDIKTSCDNDSYRVYVFMGDNYEVKYFVDPSREEEHKCSINYRIRPKNSIIENYYNNLDNFEKILLNRDNDFTATFEVFKEGDYGYYIETKRFKFPKTYGDYNLGSNGISFTSYVDGLSKIGEFYDENFTDNMWRSMTHEAIKNFDWTYTRHFNPGDEAEFVEGGNKIEKIIRIYGREFDEIKSYIDAIADNNKITYDNINNLPDYFFSDKLEDDGWDVKLITPFKLNEFIEHKDSTGKITYEDKTGKFSPEEEITNVYQNEKIVRRFTEDYITVKPYTKYMITSLTPKDEMSGCDSSVNAFGFKISNRDCLCDGETSFENTSGESHRDGYHDNCCHLIKIYSSENEYSVADVNSEFLKRFILNSKSILRHKGTIDSIEMVLAMFGLKSRNFVFSDETYFNISGGTKVSLTDIGNRYYAKTDLSIATAYDYDIKEYTLFTTRFTDTYDSSKEMYKMDWINSLKLVSYNTEKYKNGIYEPYQGLPVSYRQATNATRYIYPSYQNYLPYDGGLYYQMNGGWISEEPCMFDSKNNIIVSTHNDEKKMLFTETLKNIKCVETISELLSNKSLAENTGDICQVLEVSPNMTKKYAIVDGSVYDLLEDNGQKYFYVTVNNFSLTVGNAFFTDYVYISNPYTSNGLISINLNDEAYNGKSIRVYVVKKEGNDTIDVHSNSNSITTFSIFESGKYMDGDNFTNYFRINNPDFNNELSVLGWQQLRDTDYEYYIIDSITDYNKGNNPHSGHMTYDKGHEYLSHFSHLFKPIYENGLFYIDGITGDVDVYSESAKYGFKYLTNADDCVKDYDEYLQEDSKCHYFGDLLFNNGTEPFKYDTNEFSALTLSSFRKSIVNYDDVEYLKYGSNISGGDINNLDGVTNQIVNTKRVDIEFYLNSPVEYSVRWLEETKYIESVILPYVSQVIPSNIILTVKYKSKYDKNCA